MAGGIEIANAYVSVTTRMPGAKKDIEGAIGGVDVQGAGAKIGDQITAGISGRSAAIAGAVGGIFATVANQALSGIGNLVGDAVSASDATDKFKQSLNFAGLKTTAIADVSKATRKYADDTVYDLDTIQNTTAQLASNGVPNFEKLTEAAGNLNAIAGGNSNTFSSVAMVLTQTAGAGKLTTENWNQLANAIPGASGVLQKALLKAGAYTGNFRDAMAKGQITADEFNAALKEVGSKPIAVAAAKSTSTFEGAVGNLQATIVGGLSDALNAAKPILTGVINGLGAVFSFVEDNIGWIGPLAAGIAAATAAWVAYSTVMKLVAIYQTAAAAAEGGLTVAQWLLNAAMDANPIGLIILGIGLLIGAVILLVTHWGEVVSFLTTVWQGFVTWFMGVLNAFLGWWNGLWTAVWTGITTVWNFIVAAVVGYFTGMFRGFVLIGAAISSWWNGLWSGIASFFGGIWGGILGAIRNVQNAFRVVFSAIGSIVRGAFNGVVGIIRGVINSIISAVNGVIGGINGVAGAIGNAIGINIRIPSIPHLAQGGVVSQTAGGTLAVVGEGNYDEAVVPLTPAVKQNLEGRTDDGLTAYRRRRQDVPQIALFLEQREIAYSMRDWNRSNS